MAGQQLTYLGDLDSFKFVSLVDSSLNSNNPCVNPTVAAQQENTLASGPIQGAGKVITIPQATLLDISKIYAVCYAESSGSVNDLTWRDSFIRLTISEVETISSIGVTHRTTGQIGDHAQLLVSYAGSLGYGQSISLVQADLNNQVIGYSGPSPPGPSVTNYPFPCAAEAQAEGTADAYHSGVVQSGAGNKNLNVDTQSLQRADNGGNILYFAVCYSTGTTANAGTAWVDSGIRVTITEVFEVKFDSGQQGPSNKDDTRPRQMSSDFKATNRLPQAPGQALEYVTHSTSTLALAAGNNKWISIVDASLQGGDPCVVASEAAKVADTTHSGAQQANPSDKVVSIPQTAISERLAARDGSGNEKVYAVCYSLYGDEFDDTWRDSYIRLRMTKVTSIEALSVTHKTIGQVPNTPASLGMEFTYDGSLALGQYIAFVDSTLNTNDPCSSAGTAAAAAECPSSATCTTGAHSGVQQAGAANRVVTTFDTTGLSTTILFALCYAENDGSLSDTTWADSGVRLTVPKVHSFQYSSEYTGTSNRVLTSYPAATNRLPRVANIDWTYIGDLAGGNYISVVLASLNSGNPCVDPTYAAATAIAGNLGNNLRRYSGVLQGTAGKVATIPQAPNNLLDPGTLTEAYIYAVCYSDGDGSTTDVNWRDSYVRVKPTNLHEFMTKEVTHRTYGQIPSHPAGLQYEYTGPLNTGSTGEVHVALVDATLGTLASTGFSTSISNPCECAGAACSALSTGTADDAHSGKAMRKESATTPGTYYFDTIPSTQLVTSKVYALCYASNSVDGDANTGNFFDSGIRLTVPKVTGIQYSGYSQPVATSMNKATRLIKSVDAALQPTAEIVANVLPQTYDMPIVYVGDLAVSKHISIVAVTAALNNKNPCVDPSIAAAAGDTLHSGVATSCISYENLCTAIGAGATTAGNKEVTIYQDDYLNAAHSFAVCYAEGDGSTSDSTWRDSYIRVTISEIDSIIASGVTHSDHGLIADHVASTPLQIQYTGTLGADYHLSLVDETKNSNNPCALSSEAGKVVDTVNGLYSGPLTATGGTTTVPATTDVLSTTTQFAVCYTTNANSNFVTSPWADSGIRVKKAKIDTIRYNYGQLPSGQFLRDHETARVTVGGPGYASVYDHTYMHKIPTLGSGSLALSYIGDLAASLYVALVSTSLNSGDPCALASAAGGVAAATRSGVVQADGSKAFAFTSTVLQGLDATSTYTICYAETLAASGTTDAAYSGMGHIPDGWRDSYIRFTISRVEFIESHQVQHRTQGHIANLGSYDLTYGGQLGSDPGDVVYIALVDETSNSNDACATATQVASNLHSGPVQANTATQTAILDTTALDTTANYAVCYAEGTDATVASNASAWQDSGIRVTISALTRITYNNAQPGTVATGQYKRVMTSNNRLLGATDLIPEATNRLPQGTGVALIYEGNLVVNPAAIGSSMPVDQTVSIVAASLNSLNPCADRSVASASNDGSHSGAISATGSSRDVTLGQALDEATLLALCYTTGDGSASDYAWRDSYIRMYTSKVSGIASYGITHVTDGMIASRAALTVKAEGTLGAASTLLSMVDATANNNQPCDKTHAGVVPDSTTQTDYSGISTANANSKHTLKTDLLSSAKTFALCYAEGSGDTSDSTWADSGLRLNTPKLTSIKYMHPPRTLTATSCFGDIGLWGAADCRYGAAAATADNGATAAVTSSHARNSQLPRAASAVIA